MAARAGRSFGARSSARPLAGLATVAVVGLIIALAIALFRGSFTKTEPITLISDRAGLVMNPDAKVKMRGVQVGTVSSIEQRADGKAVLHLAMNPAQLHLIPGNVQADIASTTVFGAKYVQLVPPDNPSAERLRPGQTLQGDHVTVEMNTVFQQLTNVLDKIDPVKLNETLGALSSAFSGRGEAMGQSLVDFNAVLKKIEPSLPNLTRDIESMAAVSTAYGDAAPDLLKTFDNTNRLSDSIVAEQQNLDNFLVSSIGLADIGNDVIGGNRQALSTTLNLMLPTTNLLNEYAPGLNCALRGMVVAKNQPPQPDPGVLVNVAFTLGIERYRYPSNLPKVAAKGGPHCMGLPDIGFGNKAKYLVVDTDANPWQYGNQGILLNSDGLKQILFGPLDGPPRNTTQIGQPG
ncbi:MCE family protein [[Mycobacterium] fortunisiensis]|uniref:MCE family protein n=1 Tax=[Mycobacterium] fortunisiensis TaxID=2600579 RepID=UPI0027E0BB5C|nr:MCE family protein [[Mycobacterium] fortunisiensis]